jgi:alpha-tubulin suppressor-like RCC1 family protein/fibronectin type 3 domain-containing protein
MARFRSLAFFSALALAAAVVLAACAGDEGGSREEGSGTQPSTTTQPPSAPSNVTIAGGNGQVTISWDTISKATSYNLYWSTVTGVTKASGTKIAGVSSPYTHTGLANGTGYFYVVTAVNAGGESAESAQVSATPQVPAPGAPTGVSATAGNGQVTISWSVVSGATSYNLYWSTVTGVTKASGTKIAGVSSPYNHTGLANGTAYFYVVTAVNAGGESPESAQVGATTQVPAPGAPTGVSATAGNGQVTISWSAVSGATSYNLYWSTVTGVTKASGTKIAGVSSPYTHTGLANGTAYYYVVTAVNAGGESAESAQVGATPQVTAPGAPTGVTATTGDTQITISWNAVTGASSYNLYWSTTPGVTKSTGTRIQNATSPHIHSGLTAGTAYYYVVTAVNSAGESPDSAQVSAVPVRQLLALALAAGSFRSCARLDNGTVKCWGYNLNGELGLGDTANRGDQAGEMGDSLPTVSLGTGRTATALAPGGAYTCALLDNGTVKCWGHNGVGQLGLGDTAHRGDGPGEMGDSLPTVSLGTGRTATALAAGSGHTCARLDNGSVKCWGANSSGQLGLGDTAHRGDQAGEMGESLPTVSLGTGRTATALAPGGEHTCALLDNGTVKCWGNSFYGQLGLGDQAQRGDGPGEMGDSLPTVSLGSGRTATALAAGNFHHTCALLDNGTVKCWGYNFNGELGLGDTAHRGDGPGEMGDSLPTVSLGTGRTATALAVGSFHSCARLDNGSVKCWGWNLYGQLGLGDKGNRGDGAAEMGDSLPAVSLGTGRTVTALAAGGYHNCARLDNGSVKCWGYNSSGQLGLGYTSNNWGDEPGEMGDNLPTVSLGTTASP